MRTGPRIITLVAALALTAGSACSKSSSAERAGNTLRLSMIPTSDPGKMAREAEPLKAYLEQATGAKIELTIPLNYAAVVEALGAGKIDIGHFGGFTYVQGAKRFGARPLVQRDRDV